MHDSALTLDLSQIDGSAFLTLHGEIDAHSVAELRAALDTLQPDRRVLIDMAGVGFMDSSGIQALVDHARKIEDAGGSLRIVNPSRSVRRVMELTRLSDMFFDEQIQFSR